MSFKPGTAELEPRSLPILDAVASTLQGNPSILEAVILGRSVITLLFPPASGAMQASTIVPDGTWTLQYTHVSPRTRTRRSAPSRSGRRRCPVARSR